VVPVKSGCGLVVLVNSGVSFIEKRA
jgi:hypothetical protein